MRDIIIAGSGRDEEIVWPHEPFVSRGHGEGERWNGGHVDVKRARGLSQVEHEGDAAA